MGKHESGINHFHDLILHFGYKLAAGSTIHKRFRVNNNSAKLLGASGIKFFNAFKKRNFLNIFIRFYLKYVVL